jgi:hypothetical protein
MEAKGLKMTEAERLERLERFIACIATALVDLSRVDPVVSDTFRRMCDELDGKS